MLGFISRDAWKVLWTDLGLRPDGALAALFDIMDRYQEPHRHYHNANHIAVCLQAARVAGDFLEQPARLHMALALHDVVYDVTPERYPLNEELSAEYARTMFERFGGLPSVAEKIAELILATKHQDTPSGHDAKFMVDIDLWCGLGQPRSQFELNTYNIRQEFAEVPDEVFYLKNHAFLRQLLKRDRIFQTDFFHSRFEDIARSNLESYLPPERT